MIKVQFLNGAQPCIDITEAPRNLPGLLPDSVEQGSAASLGQLADRRALEGNIKSTLWVENVPLCVGTHTCVCVQLVQTFSLSGWPLAGNV